MFVKQGELALIRIIVLMYDYDEIEEAVGLGQDHNRIRWKQNLSYVEIKTEKFRTKDSEKPINV